MRRYLRLLTVYDMLLFLVVTALGLASLGWMSAQPVLAGEQMVVIERHGQLVTRVTFAATEPPRFVEVALGGGKATVEIRDGRVRVHRMPDALCPLHICSDTGWIDNHLVPIVCLPNRMVVRIEFRQVLGGPHQVDGVSR